MPPADPTPPADDFPAGQTGDMREVLLSPPTGAKPATASAGRWEPPSAQELAAMLPQYEIESMLGRGGMGAVYKGTQIALDRPVAIKILSNQLEDADASFAERFKNEAKAMAKLSHPGIVGVYDFGETAGGLLYIVMEFIEGTDVAKMLAQKKRLHTEHAMAITAHVCDALAYAHERGIIHRDIKPANIMVGYDGVVKVADFGLAKMTHNQNSGLTQSGMAMGTLHYMAPEALMLGSAVDHRADIYAVGVMLYQMLTGKIPQGLFELPSLQVPGLDPRYDSIIGKALREDRELRYPRVLDLRHDLDAILTQPVVKVEPSAEKAPAALQTQARPQRPGGQPYRSPQPEVIVRKEKKSSPLLWVALIAMSGIAGWLFFKDSKSGALPSPKTPPTVSATTTNLAVTNMPSPSGGLASVTKSAPFVNTLGMKFVPVPGTNVLMCMHETRKSDYAAFAAETPGTDGYWKNPTLEGLKVSEGDDHPVVSVNSLDADAFCQWLSKKEGRSYRLPSWREWGWAVGTGPLEQEGATVAEMKAKVAGIYPWGRGWPPPKGAGNMGDEALKARQPTARIIEGYQDGYATTAPVMSFQPNEIGIYDLCGNVYEWCGDLSSKPDFRLVRSSHWRGFTPDVPLVSSNPGDVGQPRMLRWPDLGFRVVLELSSSTASAETVSTATPPSTPAKATAIETTKAPPMTTAKPAEVVVKESVPLTLPTGPTTWTDAKGRTITATFKAIASGNVLLDIAGKVTPVPLNTLSAASQKLARDYQQSSGAGAAKSTVQPSQIPADAFAHGTSRYSYFAGSMSWQEARTKAESLGGHLVTFNTQGEEAAVLKHFRTHLGPKKLLFWTGGIMDKGDDSWRWTTGEPFAYTHWEPNEPNNTNGKGDQGRGLPPFVIACRHDVNARIGWCDFSSSQADWQRLIDGYIVEWEALSPKTSALTPSSANTADNPESSTKDKPFVNSLGMKFVPVPGTKVLFCIHETSYKDWAAYAAAEKVNPRWKVSLNSLKGDRLEDYPVKNVTHDDAVGFCEWMTKKEGKTYRLPTDQEWSNAVGIGEQEDWTPGATPESRSGKLKEVFPWGTAWPPPSGAGNYADSSWHESDPSKHQFIAGYTDGFATLAPVMSFQPNSLGIYDLGGNLTEWVEDWWNADQKDRAARGSSLAVSERGKLFSSTRYHLPPSIFYANGGWGFRVVLEVATSAAASLTSPPAVTQPASRIQASPAASALTTATKDKPFTNSLGMKFVPVPGTKVLMCIHETRRQDFATHAVEMPNVSSDWKDQRMEGNLVGDKDDHPVVSVSWEDAQKFCRWLSTKEGKTYRVPTDREWSMAVGIGEKEPAGGGATPAMLRCQLQDVYPWGGVYPLKTGDSAGNYADASFREKFPQTIKILPLNPSMDGYADGFPTTAPVMSFKPNQLGLYDLGGNVWEACDGWYDNTNSQRFFRGGSWCGNSSENMLSSVRYSVTPEYRHPDLGFRVVLELPAP